MANSGSTDAELRFLHLGPAARYALLALRVLAGDGKGRFHLVQDTARRAGVPVNMTAKAFQRLARFGLLDSKRGPGGGYALAKAPEKVALADVLRILEEMVPGGHRCLLRGRPCGPDGRCPMHDVLAKADRLVLGGVESMSLLDLAQSGGWK